MTKQLKSFLNQDKPSLSQTNKRVFLHSAGFEAPGYLLHLIDAGIYLLSQEQINPQEPKTDESLKTTVEIILHHTSGVFTLKAFLGYWLKGRFLFKQNYSLADWLKSWFLSKQNHSIAEEQAQSIYQKVQHAKETVTIETQLGNLVIHRATTPLGNTPLSWIKCYSQAIKMWWDCHEQGELVPLKFLALKYQGVVIGDLIASQALRKNPKAGGSLVACPNLFANLVTAIFLCHYIHHDIKENLDTSYIMIGEPTYYQHALYKRLLHSRGATVLETAHYGKEYKLIVPSEPIPNPRIPEATNFQLSETDRNQAQTYLHERIYDPRKHLRYMVKGYNRTDDQVLDLNKSPIELNTEQLSAVVFLHSFDDGQYWYGVDGFDDIYHWTVFTIDHLIANSEIEKVLIKKHPNVNYSRYPGDKLAMERLEDRYKNSQKISWLQKDCSLLALSQQGCLVGITHHGSVAEELTFLGVPVIASIFAPWGNNYKFAQTWKTPSEYQNLLNHLSVNTCKKPSPEALDELYSFVKEFRLQACPSYQKFPWMKYVKSLTGKYPAGWKQFSRWKKELDSLTLNDPNFKRFLSFLVESRTEPSKS